MRSGKFSSTTIDLVFSDSNYVYGVGVISKGISDHDMTYLIRKKEAKVHSKITFFGRSYSKLSEERIIDHMNRTDWTSFSEMDNPEEMWEFVETRINKLLDEVCPFK